MGGFTPLLLLFLTLLQSHSFLSPRFHQSTPSIHTHPFPSSISRRYGGFGVATEYSWHEQQYTIDLTLPLPSNTTVQQIHFHATSTGIDLRINPSHSNTTCLLNGTRTMMGVLNVDDTGWSLSETNEELTVHISKRIVPVNDPMQVVEYDWGGIYKEDKVGKKYDVPEELNVKEYAAKLGVDIDNIDETMVDKGMFSRETNLTEKALEELTKVGYVKERKEERDLFQV